MQVKDNQPNTRQAMERWFADVLQEQSPVERTHKERGRIVTYRLWVTEGLTDYLQELGWPQVGQCFRLERRVRYPKSGVTKTGVRYGLLDLSPKDLPADDLLLRLRHHWLIESLHWVCDATWCEDRSTCRTGSLPFTLNLLRKALISLMRWSGHADIAAQRSAFAASLDAACSFVGIPLT